MSEAPLNILDGTVLDYTYDELGTVRVSFDDGLIGFDWTDGPFKGESGQGFEYRARQVGPDQFFVNWHEPEARGYVTLYTDLKMGIVHSSVLAGYATDDEQSLFHSASINSVERPQK